MPLKLLNYYFDFTIKLSLSSFRPSRNYNISLPKFLVTDEIFKGEIFTLILYQAFGHLDTFTTEPFLRTYKPTTNYLTFKPLLL